MNKNNLPLIIGVVLTVLFIFVAVAGPMLAPIDPMERFSDVIRDSEGNIYIPSVRPLPPFTLNMFPLGTDNAGRDILSRLLWAVRPTLVACTAVVLGRLLVAVPLGLIVGWFHGSWLDRLTDSLISIIVAIPQLLLAIALIALNEDKELSLFIFVLTIIGWPDMMQYVRNQTLVTRKAEFIESAHAIGAGPVAIMRRHIFPQLWPALPSLIAFELSAVLLVFAELGFLGFFIGNGYVIFGADPNSPGVIATGLTAGTPELGQMLSDFWAKIFESPWEMVSAATVIFLMIFGFNMLGEGLRRQMDITR